MLNQLLMKWQADKERISIIFQSSQYTYPEISSIISVIANNLYQQGIKKNSKVALFMDNRPELIWLYFAIFKLGAVAVPVNYRYKSAELNYVLQDCQAEMLITEEIKEQYVEPFLSKTNSNLKIFSLSKYPNKNWDNFSVLLEEKTRSHPDMIIKEEDLAVILYTSGSTSNPKGVMHSHHSLLSSARNLTNTLLLNESCIQGVTLPICHVAGLIGQVISTFLVGGKIVLFPKFDAASLVLAIEKHKITHLQVVPVSLVELVDCLNQSPRDLTSLRCVMVGGDKVPEVLQEKFLKLSLCYVTEVMGMTESFSYCVNLSHDKTKLGSAGKPAIGVEIKIVDDDDKAVESEKIGEIKINSQANMIGYWKNPEETSKTLRNGWIYSGDLAYQDEDGFIWFVGRKKQLIIRGGSNIAPQEVEAILTQHPFVEEVCVIGFPDKKFRQIVCACVVLNKASSSSSSLSLQEIKDFCKDKLSDYKVPEKIFIFKALPHNATGKLDRKKIMEMSTDPSAEYLFKN
ncbi:MAG: acyl--CoA ligase [Gammaproteobacteria bacterium]|nr:acyl--CoA ligase [Gammaproteobacteria bacterium]